MHIAESLVGQQKLSIVHQKMMCAFVLRFANYASDCDALGFRAAASR